MAEILDSLGEMDLSGLKNKVRRKKMAPRHIVVLHSTGPGTTTCSYIPIDRIILNENGVNLSTKSIYTISIINKPEIINITKNEFESVLEQLNYEE